MEPKILDFNREWYFRLADDDVFREEAIDHSTWEKINLPHDWLVRQDYDSKCDMRTGWLLGNVGWYRKVFYVSEEMLARRVCIVFDGIYMNSTVYINGYELGMRPYGNTNFEYALTEHLKEGINTIAVRVDTSKEPSARWYTGSGINRSVELRVSGHVYIPTWGMSVTSTYRKEGQANVDCTFDVNNSLNEAANVCITTKIISDNQVVAYQEDYHNLGIGQQKLKTNIQLTDAKLWELESPQLYTCQVSIQYDGHMMDQYEQVFGIRMVEFKPHEGMFLNGKNIKLKGVCLHNDCGVVGSAVPRNVWYKRLTLLKEMGCNAVRTAHHPFAKEFYECCNALGLMVMDEIFDGWEQVKAPYDYGMYFEEWYEKDLENFITRDRNHPCVVLWSIGNEVHGMNVKTTKMLQDKVHALDSTRLVTCGIQGTGQGSDDNRAVLDIAGYNDGGGACFVYERDHERRPEQLFVATEAPHSYHTRGFYRTQTWWRDKNQPRMEIENLTEEEIFFDGHLSYSSSYDNAGVRTCARDSWEIAEQHDYLCGEFRWTGFDYYGESFGWPSRFVANGVIDTANFVKDHYYLYQSMWTDEPMIHCLPHWTHPDIAEGTLIPIWVYTNCEEAELILNGRSIGRQIRGDQKHLSWDVPYEPGEMRAIAYTEGCQVASKQVYTAGIAERLNISVDLEHINVDKVAQVSVGVVDKSGELVPYADNSICFIDEGELELIGTENGDAVDLTPLRSKTRKAFNGLVAGYVKGKQQEACKGRVHVVGILGETVFKESTTIHIDTKTIDWEQVATQHLQVYYTLDLSQPTHASNLYNQPITIDKTTWVRIAIYKDTSKIGEHQALFVKGEKEKVIDLTHGNKVLDLTKPLGPFAKQIIGVWQDGSSTYCFKADGEFVRVLDNHIEQAVGYWWYDFPVDYFEAQDYAGTGEIWFVSGEKQPFKLLTQEAIQLEIDNTQKGFSTAYGSQKLIQFQKVKS